MTQPDGGVDQSLWTRPTKAVLLGAILVVALAITAAIAGVKVTHARKADDAVVTLESFLSAALTGDRTWTELAAPEFVEEFAAEGFPEASPFRGVESAAQALDLSMSYAIVQTEYAQEPRKSHYLEAQVELTYEFTAGQVKGSTTALQTIWVTRPFFYDGQESATGWRYEREAPDQIGPWKVTAVEAAHPNGTEGQTLTTEFDAPGSVPLASCASPLAALSDLSARARETGAAASDCFLSDDAGAVADEHIRGVVAAHFPYIAEPGAWMRGSSWPGQEILDVRAYAKRAGPVPVFTQYLVPMAEEEYVVTLAAYVLGTEPVYHVINIGRAQ